MLPSSALFIVNSLPLVQLVLKAVGSARQQEVGLGRRERQRVTDGGINVIFLSNLDCCWESTHKNIMN
jgi:hypothetical protein